jgi:peptide/nickel transport system substrate-binding protein
VSEPRQHPFIPRLQQLLVEGKVSRREFLRDATLLGLSATAAYAFAGKVSGTAAVPAARAAELPQGGRIRIALRVGNVEKPHTYSWFEPEIARQVIPAVTKTGADNVTRPHLAERWEVSEDLKSWTFFLRKDVKWRKDGRPLSADDVIWNLRQVLDETVGSPALGLMQTYMLNEVDKGKKDEAGDPVMSTELWDANAR